MKNHIILGKITFFSSPVPCPEYCSEDPRIHLIASRHHTNAYTNHIGRSGNLMTPNELMTDPPEKITFFSANFLRRLLELTSFKNLLYRWRATLISHEKHCLERFKCADSPQTLSSRSRNACAGLISWLLFFFFWRTCWYFLFSESLWKPASRDNNSSCPL